MMRIIGPASAKVFADVSTPASTSPCFPRASLTDCLCVQEYLHILKPLGSDVTFQAIVDMVLQKTRREKLSVGKIDQMNKDGYTIGFEVGKFSNFECYICESFSHGNVAVGGLVWLVTTNDIGEQEDHTVNDESGEVDENWWDGSKSQVRVPPLLP